MQLSYYGSLYNNEAPQLLWNNMWSADLTKTLPYGMMGTSPDSRFHQFNLTGGYTFVPGKTRITGTASRGIGTQDDSYVSASDNPGALTAANVANMAANPTSFNGKILTTLLNSKVTTHPADKLTLSAAYKYDDRDNESPVQTIVAFGKEPCTSCTQYTTVNVPLSCTRRTSNFDAGYAFQPRTSLNVGYDNQQIKRTNSEVARTDEDIYRIDLRHTLLDQMLSSSVGYAHSSRDGSGYDPNANPYITMYANTATGVVDKTVAGPEIPLLRKYTLADCDRDRISGMVNYAPTEELSLQLNLAYNNDDYKNSVYGLTDAKGFSASLDVTYAFSQNLSANVFYTLEQMKSSERGNVNATATVVASAIVPDWTNDITDTTNTFGLHIKQKGLLDDKLELGGGANVTLARTQVNTIFPGANNGVVYSGSTAYTGTGLQATTPFPDVTNRGITLGLDGKYAIDKNASVKMNYKFMRMTTSDYAYDGVPVAYNATALGTNELSPNYTVHLIGAVYQYSFW